MENLIIRNLLDELIEILKRKSQSSQPFNGAGSLGTVGSQLSQ